MVTELGFYAKILLKEIVVKFAAIAPVVSDHASILKFR
jgi:hypothetical protein